MSVFSSSVSSPTTFITWVICTCTVRHTLHPSSKSSGACKELVSKLFRSSEEGSSLLFIVELQEVSLTPLKLIFEMWLTSESVRPLNKMQIETKVRSYFGKMLYLLPFYFGIRKKGKMPRLLFILAFINY